MEPGRKTAVQLLQQPGTKKHALQLPMQVNSNKKTTHLMMKAASTLQDVSVTAY